MRQVFVADDGTPFETEEQCVEYESSALRSVEPNFNASTRDVMNQLGLNNSKTLFRRRVDFFEPHRKEVSRFLEEGIHYRRKSPDSPQLVWDLYRTKLAWHAAVALR
jgi:hypothetical protein